MRIAFLSFEFVSTVIWMWAAIWMFTLFAQKNGDYGTIIGGLLFLAFGVGTAWMLVNEGMIIWCEYAVRSQTTAVPLTMITDQQADTSHEE